MSVDQEIAHDDDENGINYKDIVNFTPEPLLIIDDEEKLKLFNDPNHAPIFRVLRGGPMTLKQIAAAYTLAEPLDAFG